MMEKTDSGRRGHFRGDNMGIEYLIDYSCRPKKELGEEHLINLVKEARKTKTKKTVGTVESAQYLEVPTPGDDEAAKLRKELSALDFYLSDCLSCPVNAAANKTGSGSDGAFGCHMEIHFPISSHLETVLLTCGVEALQRPQANPGSKLVMGIIRSQPKSKKTPAAKVRKMGRDFFESKNPKETKITVGGESVGLDTNQMMTLIMLGPVPPQATGAFAILLERGINRSRSEGVSDPRVIAPLVMLGEQMKAARKVGAQIKVSH
jgi:hypothetical protein